MIRIATLALFVAAVAACPKPAPAEGEGEGEGGAAGEGEGSAGEGEGEGGEGEGEGAQCGQLGQSVDGFQLRVPCNVSLPCQAGSLLCGPNNTEQAPQEDILCTLHEGGHDALIYVQANPTSVDAFGDPLYADVTAFIHDDTANTTTSITASYDYGGQHHNDFFEIDVDGGYEYSHSSLGFGGRACEAPDCVEILSGGIGASSAVVTNGCTQSGGTGPFRTIPEACAYVTDGTLPQLNPDPFAKCLGDPNP
jgi:hypothetical protein